MKYFRLFALVVLVGCVVAAGTMWMRRAHAADARLESVRITIGMSGVPLDELLKEATAKTGITMRADTAKGAWKIRQLPVAVFTHEMTVAEFQTELARLLDLRWSRSGKPNDFAYTLRQDKDAREREIKALDTDERQSRQRKTEEEAWKALLEACEKAIATDIASLPDSSTAHDRYLATDPFGRAYSRLITLFGAQVSPSLMSGRKVSIPYREMTPHQQAAVKDLYQAFENQRPDWGEPTDTETVNWEQTGIVFEPVSPSLSEQWAGTLIGTLMLKELECPDCLMFSHYVLDPRSQVAEAMTVFLNEAMLRIQAGEDKETVGQDFDKRVQKALEHDASVYLGENIDSTVDVNSLLSKEILLKRQEPAAAIEFLENLSSELKLNIFAEDWRRPFGSPNRKELKGTVSEVLREICLAEGLVESLEGNVLRMAAQNWPELRAAMVPADEIENWKGIIEKDGYLSLDDVADISVQYSLDQVHTIMAADGRLLANLADLRWKPRRMALQFYGSLDSSVRKQAMSADGLLVARLTPAQKEALQPVLRDNDIDEEAFFVESASVRFVKDGPVTNLYLVYPPDHNMEVWVHQEEVPDTSEDAQSETEAP